jgi:NAD(P)-dependent dehydrogenase (short-subunit alcohol dehydrogenase family)
MSRADDPFRLDGKRAVVTGASSGIGREIAAAFGRAGAHLLLVGRNQTRLSEAAGEVRATGAAASAIAVDLTTETGPADVVAAAAAELGRIDVLVHSAGVYERAAFEETTLETLDWHWNVNLRAPFALTQAALPLLRAGSSVVFLSSVAGATSIPDTAAYAASKAGLNSLTGVLAVELAPRGIRVNAVSAGFTATPMNERLRAVPAVAGRIIASTPAGRFGSVDEIALAVVFLASDAARFVYGVVLPVDGGYPNAFASAPGAGHGDGDTREER